VAATGPTMLRLQAAKAAGAASTLLQMFISERHRRRRFPRFLIAAAVVLAGIAVGAYVFVNNRNEDVHRGDKVEFNAAQPAKPSDDGTTPWPFYHYDLAHTAYLGADVKPPFRKRWVFLGRVLMEFPTTVADNSVFFTRNDGSVYRLGADRGKTKWIRKAGSLAASTPAYWQGRLFVTTLSPGKIIAYRARDGKVLWQKALPSRTESSPIVHKGVLYFGTEGGAVYALYAKTGRVKWKAGTGGAVKASPALSGSTLYVGDYSGRMYAFWAKTGRQRWSTGTAGSKFGFASGRFYSTPAVGFGRVFAGNTDGKVYSFGADSGDLAWSKSTGGYVYSSPAIVNVDRLGPTVYVGSYDGTLYALDARTGSTRWTQRAAGRISGGVSVVGNVAYYADLDSKSTFGADIRTGKIVFRRKRGTYNPVTSDGKRIYLTGYNSITALDPRKPAKPRP
jgi:outer membrane protein assembly factor BamB